MIQGLRECWAEQSFDLRSLTSVDLILQLLHATHVILLSDKVVVLAPVEVLADIANRVDNVHVVGVEVA